MATGSAICEDGVARPACGCLPPGIGYLFTEEDFEPLEADAMGALSCEE